jgi:hypothetical protein
VSGDGRVQLLVFDTLISDAEHGRPIDSSRKLPGLPPAGQRQHLRHGRADGVYDLRRDPPVGEVDRKGRSRVEDAALARRGSRGSTTVTAAECSKSRHDRRLGRRRHGAREPNRRTRRARIRK